MKSSRDEIYVIDLCDEVLRRSALRGHRFSFLLGDEGSRGHRTPLPVDAFYPDLKLVIEFHEHQHDNYLKPPRGKDTISGVKRSVQRKMYDDRRKTCLPKHGYKLAILRYDIFPLLKKRLRRCSCDALRITAELRRQGCLPL